MPRWVAPETRAKTHRRLGQSHVPRDTDNRCREWDDDPWRGGVAVLVGQYRFWPHPSNDTGAERKEKTEHGPCDTNYCGCCCCCIGERHPTRRTAATNGTMIFHDNIPTRNSVEFSDRPRR